MNEPTKSSTSEDCRANGPAEPISKWACVERAIADIQSPKPLGANWLDNLPPDFAENTQAALDRLLVSQAEGEPVPDELWDTILGTSRAGLIRNTLAGCLRAYQVAKAKRAGSTPLSEALNLAVPVSDKLLRLMRRPGAGVRPRK
jgi:hypothetical protein